MHHSSRRQPSSALLCALVLGTAIGALNPGVAQAAPPVITSLTCSAISPSTYRCYVTFSGDNQTTATWSRIGLVSDEVGQSLFIGTCRRLGLQSITVTVTNSEGESTQASTTFLCG